MLKVLVPVDGSEASLKAVDHLVRNIGWYSGKPEVHIVNVQSALPSDVTRFLNRDDVKEYHQEEGTKELAQARAKLDAAGMSYVAHIDVGDPAERIADYTADKKIDMILIGTRALSPVAGMLVGSVGGKIIREARAPVLLVK